MYAIILTLALGAVTLNDCQGDYVLLPGETEQFTCFIARKPEALLVQIETGSAALGSLTSVVEAIQIRSCHTGTCAVLGSEVTATLFNPTMGSQAGELLIKGFLADLVNRESFE